MTKRLQKFRSLQSLSSLLGIRRCLQLARRGGGVKKPVHSERSWRSTTPVAAAHVAHIAVLATIVVGVGAGCLAGPIAAQSQPTMSPAITSPATDSMPQHESFHIKSVALGEDRLINVYLPAKYRASPSAAALPVLYMPDGGTDEDFPHIAHAVDSLIIAGAIRAVMVVGIPNTERRRDLTGPTRVASDSAIAPHVGKSAQFRQFIRDELIPDISRRYRVTGERTIIGESLAGLFIVETFLDDHALFTHYVAFDPSVWWNGGALIASAKAKIAAFDSRPHSLYLATSKEPSTAVGTSQLAKMLAAANVKGLQWTYLPRTDLEHSNIFRTLEIRGLVHALH